MTNEEKQLLLIELCARLPYGVKVNFRSNIEVLCEVHIYQSVQTIVGERGILYDVDMPNVKPYLRPLLSMTEEEKTLMTSVCLKNAIGNVEGAVSELSDFYNSRHFDYRGLIPMGLALEAPKDMYKTE